MNLTVGVDPFNPEIGIGKSGDELADFIFLACHVMSLEPQSGLRFF